MGVFTISTGDSHAELSSNSKIVHIKGSPHVQWQRPALECIHHVVEIIEPSTKVHVQPSRRSVLKFNRNWKFQSYSGFVLKVSMEMSEALATCTTYEMNSRTCGTPRAYGLLSPRERKL